MKIRDVKLCYIVTASVLLIGMTLFGGYVWFSHSIIKKVTPYLEECLSMTQKHNNGVMSAESISHTGVISPKVHVYNFKIQQDNLSIVFPELIISWNIDATKMFIESLNNVILHVDNQSMQCNITNNSSTVFFKKSLVFSQERVVTSVNITNDYITCYNGNEKYNIKDGTLLLNIGENDYRWKFYINFLDDRGLSINSNEFSGLFKQFSDKLQLSIYKLEIRNNNFNLAINGNIDLSYADVMPIIMYSQNKTDHLVFSNSNIDMSFVIDNYDGFTDVVKEYQKIRNTSSSSSNEEKAIWNYLLFLNQYNDVDSSGKLSLNIKTTNEGKISIGNKIL